MTIALLLTRLALAAVFVTAGIAKLLDVPGSREALRQFGLPGPVARAGSMALPLLELAVAVALLPGISARWAAVGALLLLSAFAIAIARALAAGRRPDCHCFGQLHSTPAGVGTLVRDLALAALALFIVIAAGGHPGPGALAWIAGLHGYGIVALSAGLVAAAVIAFLAWFCIQLLRQNGRLLARIEAVERRLDVVPAAEAPDTAASVARSPAPALALPDLEGRTRTLEELRRNLPALLVFTDPGCAPCGALLPEIALWQREYAQQLAVVVIARGDLAAGRASAEEHGLGFVLLQQDREVSEAFDAPATPSAVVVSEAGLIEVAAVAGADAIRNAFAHALRVRQPRELPKGPPIGTPAPVFELARPRRSLGKPR